MNAPAERPMTVEPANVARMRELVAEFHGATGHDQALVAAQMVGTVEALLAVHDEGGAQ